MRNYIMSLTRSNLFWKCYKISFVSISTFYVVNKIVEIYYNKKYQERYEKRYQNKVLNKSNDIILSSNRLFQVPFTEDNYSGLTKNRCKDCLFHVLTALGLRSYSASISDSMKIYKEKIDGVEVQDVAKYLSTIFGATIKTDFHYFKYFKNHLNDLKNGYATFVCGDFRNIFLPFDYFAFGHFFIIYKKNDQIYYYDPYNDFTTQNISDFHNWHSYINICVAYCNVNECKGPLIKSKISIPITY